MAIEGVPGGDEVDLGFDEFRIAESIGVLAFAAREEALQRTDVLDEFADRLKAALVVDSFLNLGDSILKSCYPEVLQLTLGLLFCNAIQVSLVAQR
jgi:hypothetical protein